MNATIKIYLRLDSLNVDGTNSVCLRFTLKRKLKVFTLNVRVRPENWNKTKTSVKRSDILHDRKNKYIAKYRNKAQSIIDSYFFNDKPLSISLFTKEFTNENQGTTDFFQFIYNELEQRTYAKETLRMYKGNISKIKKFRNKIDISDINFKFLLEYKKYMIEVLNNKPITWNRSLGFIRTYMNWAIDKELIEKNPVKKFKIKSITANRVALTIKEVKILENLRNSNELNKNDKITLDYFLFDCYTGLRFRDVKDLKYKNIKNGFLDLITHKTKTPVTIPLIKASKKFIEKNGLPNQNVFNVACNQVTNKRLKKIIKIAKIDKKISFHCGRHTFATICYSLDIPIYTIKELLAQTEIKTTQIYTKISNELKAKEMQKFE